tara:strand:+ start:54 stop:653 length:600 start_codon:yes stop_codon:yes gene_type:complete
MSVIPLFPTLLYYTDVNNFDLIQKELINYCYQERKNFPESEHRSNKGNSWHSKGHYMNTKNILSTTIYSTVFDYFEKSGVFKKGVNFSFHNAWININSTGGYNDTHHHPGSLLSGVLWVKSSKDSGNIMFDDPAMFNESNIVTELSDDLKNHYHKDPEHWRNPVEGLLLMFPSYLMHRVGVNKSNEDRISISFNLDILT